MQCDRRGHLNHKRLWWWPVPHSSAAIGISAGAFQGFYGGIIDLVGQRFNCAKDEVLFVSSNGWDAGCATGYGFTTAWVNRAGEPVDRLPWTPHHILSDLTSIPDLTSS